MIFRRFRVRCRALELCASCSTRIRPPAQRSEATVCAATRGNITELAAPAVVALFIPLLSFRTAGYNGEAVRRREWESNPRFTARCPIPIQPAAVLRVVGTGGDVSLSVLLARISYSTTSTLLACRIGSNAMYRVGEIRKQGKNARQSDCARLH